VRPQAHKAIRSIGKLKEDVDLNPLREYLRQVLQEDRCYSRAAFQRAKDLAVRRLMSGSRREEPYSLAEPPDPRAE
jgi:hypothetical protein